MLLSTYPHSNADFVDTTTCATVEMWPMLTQKECCNLKLGGAAPHPDCVTFSCKPLQCTSEMTVCWSLMDDIIEKQQRWDPNVTKLALSRPRLLLDVRSMNITYRGSRQAALSESDAQLNVLESVPKTQTQLSLVHRVTAAWSSDPGTPYCQNCICIFYKSTSWNSCSAVYVFAQCTISFGKL